MKKIAFIIPYFGKFNNYFQLFLNSCKNNPSIDWLIFTDDKTNYDYPENVKVNYYTFAEVKKLFESKFDFTLSLNKPYKLCDFKPTYGYVFSDYLNDYDFWGFCDTDLIFGNIRKFYNDEILDKFDKIGFFGHCTIFKNTKKINELFKSSLNGKEIYKTVYSSENGFAFDEEFHNSINDIFLDKKINCFFEELQANIYRKSSDFKLTIYNFDEKKYYIEKKSKNFFIYNDGSLIRYNINGDKKEYLYIHMQGRKMKVNTKDYNTFKIIPNSFDSFNMNELKNIKKIRIKHFNLHYFKHRGKNLIIKVKKRLSNGN